MHALSEGLQPGGRMFSADQWHTYCKSRWLGCRDMDLPNGRVLTVPQSSASLSSDEFNAYMEAVEAWAATREVFLDE